MAHSCLHDAPVYLLPPLIGFLAFFSLALLSFFRSRRNQTNIYFSALCLLGGLINLDVALISLAKDGETALLIDRIICAAFVFCTPVYIHFTHSFLGIKRKGIERASLALTLAILPFIPTDLFFSGMREYPYGRIAVAGPVYHVFSAAGGMAVSYCLLALLKGTRGARGNEERNRIKYVLAGISLSAVLITLNYISVLGFNIYPFGNFSFIPATVLAIGIMKYDLLDIDAAIRKGILYFAMSLVLTVSFLSAIYAAQLLFSSSSPAASPFIPFAVAIVLAVCFQPLRDRLQASIDRVFFKGKYDYRTMLREVSGRLGTLLDPEAVKEYIMASIHDALRVSAVSLVTFEADGRVLVSRGGEAGATSADGPAPGHHISRTLLERKACLGRSGLKSFTPGERASAEEFFERYGASLLVPILSRDGLSGIIAVGEKLSGELFVHEDIELLLTVANQGATALDNARHYSRIRDMNRELEKKVEERTAELRREIREKEAARDQLIRSESLAAIGQLVAGTAHELNNPLASAYSLVQSSLEGLERKPEKSESEIEMIDDLEFSLKEMRRARDIIRSLLDLSRQSGGMDERIDVNAVIEDALRVLHNQHKNSRLLIEKDFGDVPPVRGNFGSLGQVFINVIKNAIEAAPADGKGVISLSTACTRDRVLVECRDNGTGIPEEKIKDIFKPFFTTKDVGKGTGLGLYISHELISRHGGTIQAANNPRGGAKIQIELPKET